MALLRLSAEGKNNFMVREESRAKGTRFQKGFKVAWSIQQGIKVIIEVLHKSILYPFHEVLHSKILIGSTTLL
jgi:hypothetical protein